MCPDTPSEAEELVDLSAVVGGMAEELRCLLGPAIHLATSGLPASGQACVRVRHEDIEDLLRHLALDTHDAMPAGGRSTIRTGRLHEPEECAAILIHEIPDAPADAADPRTGKGRSLGLGAAYDVIKRTGGHFHVSCRGGETVITICFPLGA